MVIIPYRVECICDRTERIYNIGGAPPTGRRSVCEVVYGISQSGPRLLLCLLRDSEFEFHRPTRFYCHDAEEIFQSRIARPPINFFLLPPKTT